MLPLGVLRPQDFLPRLLRERQHSRSIEQGGRNGRQRAYSTFGRRLSRSHRGPRLPNDCEDAQGSANRDWQPIVVETDIRA